jgi:hypothetical protein
MVGQARFGDMLGGDLFRMREGRVVVRVVSLDT